MPESKSPPRRPRPLAPVPLSPAEPKAPPSATAPPATPAAKDETGGPTGAEPTRYGDWERKGRCVDF
jgi:hypothetical protein